MTKISQATVSRILGKLTGTKIVFKGSINVSPHLWHKLEKLSDEPTTSNTKLDGEPNIQVVNLIQEVFESSDREQRISLGSALQETLIKDLSLARVYLQALVHSGSQSQALTFWKNMDFCDSERQNKRKLLGIELFIRTKRVRDAESLAVGIALDSRLCMSFVNAYIESRNEAGVRKWLRRLFSENPSVRQCNLSLERLTSAGMWTQAHFLIGKMSSMGYPVNNELITVCLSRDIGTPSGIAAILASDGSLINQARFRNLVAGKRISTQPHVDAGSSSAGCPSILRNSQAQICSAYQVLNSIRHDHNPQSRQERLEDVERSLISKISNIETKDSFHIQTMLLYHQLKGDWAATWRFCSDLSLFTHEPSVTGGLSYPNYYKLWQLIFIQIRTRKECHLSPTDLQQFVAVTVKHAFIQSPLLTIMALTLANVDALSELMNLLRYASESNGIMVNYQKLWPQRDLGPDPGWLEIGAQFLAGHEVVDLEKILVDGENVSDSWEL